MTKLKFFFGDDENNRACISILCRQDRDVLDVIDLIKNSFNFESLEEFLVDVLYLHFLIENCEFVLIYDEFLNETTISAKNESGEKFIKELYDFLKQELGEE